MGRSRSIPSVTAVLAALVAMAGIFDATRAAEFRFVAESVGDGRAIWTPNDVTIHKGTDLADGLIFVLDNPTDRTHAFAVYGLFEEVTGGRDDQRLR